MKEITTDEIAAAIITQLKLEQCALLEDPADHAQQHAFVKMLMEERAEKLERRKRMKEKIAGSLVLSALAATLTGLGWLGKIALEAFRQWVNQAS